MNYAEKGEAVYCENGHKVLEFVRTVKVREGFEPSQVRFFKGQRVPCLGEDYRTCLCWCGKRYTVSWSVFLFGDGWRFVTGGGLVSYKRKVLRYPANIYDLRN